MKQKFTNMSEHTEWISFFFLIIALIIDLFVDISMVRNIFETMLHIIIASCKYGALLVINTIKLFIISVYINL